MNDIEAKLNAFFARHRDETNTSPSLDRKILEEATTAQHETRGSNRRARIASWRIRMKQKRTWISAAAAVALMGLALMLFSETQQPAYAIAETLEAMKTVQSVTFKAFLYKQQMEIACQMRLDDESAKPTHIRLYWEHMPHSKIDNENGSFAYNAITNRFRRIRRDERDFNWYPDFRRLLSRALDEAQTGDRVRIGRDMDPETQQEMIVIDVTEKHRDVRYWIHPQSKLPTRFTTVKERDTKALIRPTFVVRDLWDIRYNEVLPQETFAIPKNAEEVFEEIDVIVHPGMGMPVGDLDESEACLALIESFMAAANRIDFETASKLMFPLGVPPQAVQDEIRALHADAHSPLIELLDHEPPYERGPYWFVRCRTREVDKGEREDLVRIRFFEFDGVRSCIVAMPD